MAVTEDLIDGTTVLGANGGGVPPGEVPPDGVPPDGVLSLLQQAARTIDQMWHSAQADGRHSAAVALGEASHGIHRALIALQVDGDLRP